MTRSVRFWGLRMENKANHRPKWQHTYMFEIKSLAENGKSAGYASVFNVLDSQRDIMQPGAFRDSLKNRTQPVQLLWQHQWQSPIGTIEALFEDARGLYVK